MCGHVREERHRHAVIIAGVGVHDPPHTRSTTSDASFSNFPSWNEVKRAYEVIKRFKKTFGHFGVAKKTC